MEDQINYQELGGTSDKKTFHPEGAELLHPSGSRYKRINGNWVLISKSETKSKEQEN